MLTRPISIATVFGTRPEAVKLLPVIRRLREDTRFAVRVVVTGQHREMLHEILDPFGLVPDVDLEIMQPGQTLSDIVCRAMPRLDELYERDVPDWVVVQGDTTSAFCAALAAFHRRIPVAHVEAGLRSFDRRHPYPEEANRRMLTAVTDLHFAPTARAAQNLLREGVPQAQVLVTGNTVVDALFLTLQSGTERWRDAATTCDAGGPKAAPSNTEERRSVLITMHRREAWETTVDGAESVLDGILRAIRRAADRYRDVDFIYPVHLNPKIQDAAKRAFSGADNARLIEPLSYVRFVNAMARASVIVTDSGGVQEEAPSLGIPVLVLRRTTERPEGLESGANRLVGTAPEDIERAISAALDDAKGARPAATPRPSPFGDGCASDRIARALLHLAGDGGPPEPFVPLAESEAPHPFASVNGAREVTSLAST